MKESTFEKLDQQRIKLDQKRTRFLDQLSKLKKEDLDKKNSENSWSLSQVAEHLMLAQREVLQQLPDPSTLKERPQSFINKIKFWIVIQVLKFNIRVKVPSKAMIPNMNLNLNQIRCNWDKSQTWLELFLKYIKEENLSSETPLFSHPFSGALNTTQVLKLAHIHFDSHMRKVQKRL